MELKTVLLFAHECAPYHHAEGTIGAQRPAQFAAHLPEFGWRAIVVCCDGKRRRVAGRGDREAVETEVAQRLAEADPETSLIVPTPSLTSDGAIDAAWTRLHQRADTGVLSAPRRMLTLAKYPLGDQSQPWQPCARWAAEVIARECAIDVCVGEHGPDAGLFLARWFHESHGVPWVADFRDPILRPFEGVLHNVYRPFARRLVATAEHVVNVTPYWAELDHDLFAVPTTCIPNGFDPAEFPPDDPDKPDEPDGSDETFTVSYTGNLVREQPIELALEAWAAFVSTLAPDERESVRLVYRGYSLDRVRRAAANLDLGATLDAGERIARDEALRLLQRSDLLLLFSVADSDQRSCLFHGLYPGKVFEYFGARRPILCVPGDNGQLDALLEETRTGVIRTTLDDIAGFFTQAFAEWQRGGRVGYAPDEAAVARYKRHAQARVFASILDTVAQSRAKAA